MLPPIIVFKQLNYNCSITANDGSFNGSCGRPFGYTCITRIRQKSPIKGQENYKTSVQALLFSNYFFQTIFCFPKLKNKKHFLFSKIKNMTFQTSSITCFIVFKNNCIFPTRSIFANGCEQSGTKSALIFGGFDVQINTLLPPVTIIKGQVKERGH